MLQFIRDTAKGWVAWLIIGLLIVPFALWGISEYFTGGAAANVAEVNDADITLNDYQRAYQQQQNRTDDSQQLQRTTGAGFVTPTQILQNLLHIGVPIVRIGRS